MRRARMRFVAVAGMVCSAVLGGSTLGAGAVRIEPERPSPGQVFRVVVEDVTVKGAVELRLGSRIFPLWRAGEGSWEGLAAIDRDESATSREYFVVDAFPEGEQLMGIGELSVAPREYGFQEIKVDESLVTLSPADQARADRENVLIRAVFGTRTDERLWTTPFRWPTPGEVTGPYGVRRVYNGKPKGYHNGIDIAAPRGAPVAASAAGRVALAGDYFYTGTTVFLDHGLGLYTAYFHLDSAAVVEGERVEPGAVVGLVGSSGRSTGPHLHWGVYLSGLRVDPLSLLELSGGRDERAPAPKAGPVGE